MGRNRKNPAYMRRLQAVPDTQEQKEEKVARASRKEELRQVSLQIAELHNRRGIVQERVVDKRTALEDEFAKQLEPINARIKEIEEDHAEIKARGQRILEDFDKTLRRKTEAERKELDEIELELRKTLAQQVDLVGEATGVDVDGSQVFGMNEEEEEEAPAPEPEEPEEDEDL